MSDEALDLQKEVETLRTEVVQLRSYFKITIGVLIVGVIPVVINFPLATIAIPAAAFVVWLFFT